MKTVIFLGPTLPVEEAQNILDAIYLPPVEQAGLLSAITTHRPDVIGIIDGLFGQSLSVWHKEILYALKQGIQVFGASSMGALRAAETCDFGAIGIGEIFRMYRTGEINDDDEVALVHGSSDTGYKNISEPMVNIRKTFELARNSEIIDKAVCQEFIDTAKALYYPDRVWANIFSKAGSENITPQVIEKMRLFVRDNYVNIKRTDAIELLETIRALEPSLPPPAEPYMEFVFHKSPIFRAIYNRDRTVRCQDLDISLEAIANYTALHMPGFSDFNFNALNRALVVIMAGMFKIDVSEEDIEKEQKRFTLKQNISEENDLAAWIRRNHLSDEEFHLLMREMALCRRLHKWLLTRKHLEKNVKGITDQLRLSNIYEEWLDKAANQEAILQTHYPHFTEIDHGDMEFKELFRNHHMNTNLRVDTNIMEWAAESGFHGVMDFRVELLRAKLARDHIQSQINNFFSDTEEMSAADEGGHK